MANQGATVGLVALKVGELRPTCMRLMQYSHDAEVFPYRSIDDKSTDYIGFEIWLYTRADL